MRSRGERAALDPPLEMPIGLGELATLFGRCHGYRCLLIAVSGGADSVALLHLARDWAQRQGGDQPPRLLVATVDHGLRPESRNEAIGVAEEARRLGLSHAILTWTGNKPKAGLQAAAREARYRLLAEEARRSRAEAILTAHTRDDQAETLLMRLARGSSVDGLAGMRPVSDLDGVELVRPFLDVPRARLVATLVSRGVTWLDDPSNDDERFERVRLRRARDARTSLGLTDAHLALTARRLDRVRAALDRTCDAFAAKHVQLNDGAYCRIDADAIRAVPAEIALRLIVRVLWAFGGQAELPPLARTERLAEMLVGSGGISTLGGCRFAMERGALVATREPGRRGLAQVTIVPGATAVWDRRFQLALAAEPRGSARAAVCRIRALGPDGLQQLRARLNPSATGKTGTQFASLLDGWPRQAIATLPSLWHGDDLMAVPHCGNSAPVLEALPLQSAIRADFPGRKRFLEWAPGSVMLG